MDARKHGELLKDARELRRLDEQVVKALAGSNISDLPQLIAEFSELRKSIKVKFLDKSVAQIHDHAARVIVSKIMQDEKFGADKIIDAFNSNSEEKIVLDELDADDLDVMASKLYEWFSHAEYIEGLYEIGSLIVGITVPHELTWYLEEARQCYAFQQYNGMNALCRTALEAGLKHYAQRRKVLYKCAYTIGNLKAYEPGKLIGEVVDANLRERVRNLYCTMSTGLHGGRQVERQEAKRIYKNSLSVLQDLFR